MKLITVEELVPVIRRLCIAANVSLPEDVKGALEKARAVEDGSMAVPILDDIISNFKMADAGDLPICQDTGLALVFIEQGEEVFLQGNLQEAVDEGVRQGYAQGYLRKSVVSDPIARVNSLDNTPAQVYLKRVPGAQVKVTVAPKGFGSENMSRLAMLRPSDGIEGVKDFVIKAVLEAGGNPCPPVILGVGIGGTFDRVALAAKEALLREVGSLHEDPYYADLEAELLETINRLGVGPQGFGGRATALAVHIQALPTHIAGLPVGVNFNCHVARHVSEVLE